ncbi:hypothetical protein ACVBGC_03695 [Burkholderia stagnalis]
MRSLFNDAHALVDADNLRIWTGPDACERLGEPAFAGAHGGDPAGLLAVALAGLPKARATGRNRLHLRFAHPWSHAVVLPWQTGLWSDAAWEAYAGAVFQSRALRMPLAIRIADAGFGRARLAFALRDDVLGASAAASRAAGWRVAACRDALSVALNAHARGLRDRDCCFALAQSGVVTCLFRRDGEWCDVVALSRRAGQRIDDLIGAAALMGGHAADGARYLCGIDELCVPADGGRTVRLDGPCAEVFA